MCFNNPSTVQTTQNTTNSVPSFVTDAQLGLQGYGQGILGSALNSDPNYYVAGLTEDQLSGQKLLRGLAQNGFQTARPTVPTSGYAATGTGGVATYNPTGTGGPALVDAASIQEQMNPYTGAVIDTTLDKMRKGYAQNSADIGARAAASGAYGGSQEAIERSQLAKNYGDSLASTVAQLQSAGYDKAASLAGTNAQMRNANALSNAGIMNDSARFNAQSRNSDAQFNAGVLNAAGQYGASQGLQGAQLQNTLLNDEQTRRMSLINAILGVGGTNQTLLQNTLNVPTSALNSYRQLVPSQVSTTSNTVGTQPNTAPSTLQTILGLGGTLLGANVGGSTLGGKLLGSVFG